MLQENHCIEFKSTLNDNFEKEIIAFLNSRDGGSLYLGIEDTGRVIGVDKVDETQLMIANRLRDRIVPSVMGLFDICVKTWMENKLPVFALPAVHKNLIIFEIKACRPLAVLFALVVLQFQWKHP